MARSYSEASYGGRQNIKFGLHSSVDGTYQSAVSIARYTFMYPAKVVDWNVEILAGATDLTNLTNFTIGKSLGGTGAVSGFGTADMLGATATHANGTVVDASATETSFVAGDDVVLQGLGTVGHAMVIKPNLEIQEVFTQGDT